MHTHTQMCAHLLTYLLQKQTHSCEFISIPLSCTCRNEHHVCITAITRSFSFHLSFSLSRAPEGDTHRVTAQQGGRHQGAAATTTASESAAVAIRNEGVNDQVFHTNRPYVPAPLTHKHNVACVYIMAYLNIMLPVYI